MYLAKDVLLLADVFEKFRQTCIEYYKLDPCHFISTPDLSWNAYLYQAYREAPKFTLELMTDSDMYLMIEKGIRGGLSQIGDLRYAKADQNDKVKEDGENCEKNEEAREEDGKERIRTRNMGRKRMRIGRKRRMRTRKMEEGQTTCHSEITTTNDTETDTTVNSSATSTRKNGITTTITAVLTTVVTTSTTTTKTTITTTTTTNNRRKRRNTKRDETKWDETDSKRANNKRAEIDKTGVRPIANGRSVITTRSK